MQISNHEKTARATGHSGPKRFAQLTPDQVQKAYDCYKKGVAANSARHLIGTGLNSTLRLYEHFRAGDSVEALKAQAMGRKAYDLAALRRCFDESLKKVDASVRTGCPYSVVLHHYTKWEAERVGFSNPPLTADQLQKLERCFEDGKNAPQSAVSVGCSKSAAYRYYREWLDDGFILQQKPAPFDAAAHRASRFYKSDFVPT